MRFGLHVGLAEGYESAVEYAARFDCTAVQFFNGNPRSYRLDPTDTLGLGRFRELRARAEIETSVIHTSYLINLASDDPKISKGSLRLLKNDLAAAGIGGIEIVNTHLGSYGTRERSAGFAAVVAALEDALATIPPGVLLVAENSAGAGQLCGGTLEELGAFMRAIAHPQFGVCIDTAHAWASGYPINTREGVERFVEELEREVTLDRLKLFHFNDTQIPLGGHRDRHYHIGEGQIGFEGFRSIVAHPELRLRPAILETPGDEADDRRNMDAIRAILSGIAA
jgi:deoxyribonuclease-4